MEVSRTVFGFCGSEVSWNGRVMARSSSRPGRVPVASRPRPGRVPVLIRSVGRHVESSCASAVAGGQPAADGEAFFAYILLVANSLLVGSDICSQRQ